MTRGLGIALYRDNKFLGTIAGPHTLNARDDADAIRVAARWHECHLEKGWQGQADYRAVVFDAAGHIIREVQP